MSKPKAITVFVILGIIMVLIGVFAFPLNGKDCFQIGDTGYDWYWITKSISLGLDLKGGVYALFQADLDGVENADAAMEGAMENLSTLLASKGYPEATVTRQGSDNIRVEVPDVSDTEALMQLIGNPSRLEIKDENGKVWIVGDSHITNAYASMDNSGNYGVALEFNAAGAKAFAEATGANVGKTLKIIINDEEVSAPNVKETISGGNAFISGSYTYQSANDLAVQIRAGALGVSLSFLSSETISPTLGENALFSGVLAGIIGTFIIIIFLILAYRGLGLCSAIALVFYVEILLLFLAIVPWVQLTLPGIAGVILSIGMAVDANVVIFEKIKDEKYKGRGILSAVQMGFKEAFAPIFDANITTIIGAIVMIIFGATAIQSFAIVLLIGIILSMFSSLIVTRLIVYSFLAFNADSEKFYGLEFKIAKALKEKPTKTEPVSAEGEV